MGDSKERLMTDSGSVFYESRITNHQSLQLGEEFAEALESRRELRRRAGVADAQCARLAEGRARHAGHALAFEQRVAQVDVVGDDLAVVRLAVVGADVGEHVERALRTRA